MYTYIPFVIKWKRVRLEWTMNRSGKFPEFFVFSVPYIEGITLDTGEATYEVAGSTNGLGSNGISEFGAKANEEKVTYV